MQKSLSTSWQVFVGIALLLLVNIQSYAQKPEDGGDIAIEGVVVDNGTNEPIVGATVKMKNGPRGTVTSSTGRFRLEGCKPTDVIRRL